MADKTLAPQQARSRESMRKLLKAAAEVLGQHGLEGATIPRIAQHAGLTPGAIYRRFPDKDALLETVIIGILERQDERLRMMLTPAMARQIPLAVFAEQLINNMLVSYRANAGLLRALRQFAQGRDHTSFYRKVSRLEMRTYQYLVELFLRTSQGSQASRPANGGVFCAHDADQRSDRADSGGSRYEELAGRDSKRRPVA